MTHVIPKTSEQELNDILNIEHTTFQGKLVTMRDIDHQHLSNLYYHQKYTSPLFLGASYAKSARGVFHIKIIQTVLDHRFNGQLLPFRPHVRFQEEIKALERAGYLQSDGKIVVDGKEIGEIITMEEDKFELPVIKKVYGHQDIAKRQRAVAILLFSQGMVLGVSRKTDSNDFGLPGGKVEDGEDFEDAAIRETLEETGLEIFGLQKVFERLDEEYYVETFAAQWKGYISTKEKGRVKWVTFEELKSGTFGKYNTMLEKTLIDSKFFNG
jgi:ADP-ribose pyrophosphatase YjhB (NUDIX family)